MARAILKRFLRFSAKWAVKKYKPFIIAITGNTGKTSTKEAVYWIAKSKYTKTAKTYKNLNTDIGVPLSILGLEDARRNIWKWFKNFLRIIYILFRESKKFPHCFVLELAADKPGEIKYFTEFLPFHIGIVTSIGEHPVHLAFFPSRDSLISEKTWVVRGIQSGGVAILNRDDESVAQMAHQALNKAKVLFYGKSPQADIQIQSIKISLTPTGKALTTIQLRYKAQAFQCALKDNLSIASAQSIAAALACGIALGVPIKEGIQILEKRSRPLPGRMRVIAGLNDSLIIDDTYNASPLSYINALDTFASLAWRWQKIAILGDMAELGQDSQDIHFNTLKKAAGIADIIFCVGPKMNLSLQRLQKKGLTANKKIYWANDSATAAPILKKYVNIYSQSLFLVKGAQATRMEKIVKALMARPKQSRKLLVRQEKRWLRS